MRPVPEVRELEPRQLLSGLIGFGTAVNDAVVGNPVAVAEGDFNHDGVPDLAAVSPGTLSVLLGKAGGGFQAAVTTPTVANPTALAVGNFTGANSQDLAVTDASGAVDVYLNNGSGGFPAAPSSTLAVGANPTGVVAGNFSGSGNLDLVALNAGGTSLSLLPGNGDGTFQPATAVALANAPVAFAEGDFNHDGRPDLAVIESTGAANAAFLLLNNGGGTFTAQPVTLPPGYSPTQVAAGDLNGDGVDDLAFASAAGGAVVAINSGNGTSFTTQTVPGTVGGQPAAVAIGNVTGGLHNDVVFTVMTAGGSFVNVAADRGNGTFSNVGGVATSSAAPRGLVIGRFSGKAAGDVAFADSTSPNVTVLPNAVVGVTGRSFNAVEGTEVVNQEVATFLTSTAPAPASGFTATVDWGDGTPPTAGQVTQDASGTYHVAGSHTYTTLGSYTVTTTVNDNAGTTATGTATATVSAAPIVLHVGPVAFPQGAPQASVQVATFTSLNPFATANEFTAQVVLPGQTVNGVIVPTGNAGAPAFAVYTVSSNTPPRAGVYPLTVIVQETGAPPVSAAGTLQVTAPLINAVPLAVASAPENTPAGGVLARFSSSNLDATASDFSATIDWGDGSPPTAGTVVRLPLPGATPIFTVEGTHVYTDARSTTSSVFPVQVQIRNVGGTAANVTTSIQVTDVPITLTGLLDPASDSGASPDDGVTNVRNPRFFGASEPNSRVTLYAIPAGTNSAVAIGQAVTDAGGMWSATPRSLIDGSYSIVAQAVDQAGFTTATTVIQPPNRPLVIDTVGPKITGVLLGRLSGQVLVTFVDDRSGLDPSTLQNPSNYSLSRSNGRGSSLLLSSIDLTPDNGPTAQRSVLLTFNGGGSVRGGTFTLAVRSGGVSDVAGNALDGEFYGTFPTGNNVPGGDFVTTLQAIHRKVFAPGSTVGSANPFQPAAPIVIGGRTATTTAAIRTAKTVVPTATVHKKAVQVVTSHPRATRRVR